MTTNERLATLLTALEDALKIAREACILIPHSEYNRQDVKLLMIRRHNLERYCEELNKQANEEKEAQS